MPQSDDFGRLVNQVTGDFEPADSELNTMWEQAFMATEVEGQRPYEPPTGVAPYHPGEIPPFACSRGSALRDWPQGAFYCPADGWIVYDELWLRELQQLRGDFAPAAVLAHEWGHHVQRLFGETQYDIQGELQADCMAGMYLGYRELPPGATSVNPQIDEFNASLAALFALANERYSNSSWFQAEEHGSPFQRIVAFATGALPLHRGLPWCLGYREFVAEDFSEIGPYRLINLPGRSESGDDNLLHIDPESRTTDVTSAISLQWLPSLPMGDEPATLEHLAAVAAERLPGSSLVLPGVDLGPNLPRGSGWMALYETAAGATDPRSGIIGLIAPASVPGGLVVDVWREARLPGEPPAGATLTPQALDIIAELGVTMYQIEARLCGPDDSTSLESPYWNLSCLDDQ